MVYARARSILLIDNSTIVASQQSVIGGSVTGLDKAFRRGFIKIGVGPVLLDLAGCAARAGSATDRP